ncbi:MAG TPA: WD40 repeat domain-containing protein [Polyangiaceae bacterium]|nr:WD40 repeat domain-containing protein [Polyangiaceae bacterium]
MPSKIEKRPPPPTRLKPPTIAEIWHSALAGRNDEARALLERKFPSVSEFPQRPLDRVTLNPLDDGRWAVAIRGGYLVLSASGKPERFVPVSLMDANRPAMEVVPGTGRAMVGGDILDIESGRLVRELTSVRSAIGGGRVALVKGGEPPQIVVWDVRADAELARIAAGPGVYPESLRISPDGSVVFMRSGGDVERIYDAGTLQLITRFGPAEFMDSALAPDGKLLVLASTDYSTPGEVQLVDRVTGKLLRRSGACGPHRSIAISADGKYLAVGGPERVCLMSLPSLRKIGVTSEINPTHDKHVRVYFRADVLVTQPASGSTMLFSLPTLRRRFAGKGSPYRLASGEIRILKSSGEITRLDAKFREHAVRTVPVPFLWALDGGGTPEEVFAARARLGEVACDLSPWVVPCSGGAKSVKRSD